VFWTFREIKNWVPKPNQNQLGRSLFLDQH
jgi:hypothetical protein